MFIRTPVLMINVGVILGLESNLNHKSILLKKETKTKGEGMYGN